MKSELKTKLFSLTLTAILVLFSVLYNNVLTSNDYLNSSKILTFDEYRSYKEYDIVEDINDFVETNIEKFNFYCDMFGISIDDFKQELIKSNENSVLDYHNIGNTSIEYDTLDKNLIDYLFNLQKVSPKLFNQKYVSGSTYSKDYIYSLINYFSNIYDNVDYDVLASIAYIESGNLNAKFMMSVNNVYGGMSSGHLIRYQNIEYGILSYVKLMSERYYAKGLNTIEKIASRYNPSSTTWSGNVRAQLHKFKNNTNITISELISMKLKK